MALPPTSRGLRIGCLIGFVFTLAAQAEPQNPATSLQAATTDANTSLSIIKATDRNGQQSQARIEKLDDATLSRLADTRRALGEVAQLRLYNQQMALIVANQQEELAGYDSQIAAIDQTEQGILPLMVRMIDDLQRNTEQGLPFLLDERQSRIALLRDMLQRADVSVSEKYRRVLEAFQIELEYGRTLEAYRERVDGQAYDMLRVGRIGLYRLSQDQQQAWTWLMSSNGWRELPSDMLADIKQAFKVARQTTAPQLITVPLASPLVQGEAENASKEGGDV
ncbi:TonB system biopolymer transport component; Chromosome segregation ATPase [hydrothermal vent metagenome]|uniref:TonB system biopolymer transport component Chromosome segregation ATPase n=1 Tax=hydrothermal vent metagenome TaxID=652676 RepID=A0A160TAG0_9ZZZZ